MAGWVDNPSAKYESAYGWKVTVMATKREELARLERGAGALGRADFYSAVDR